MKYFALVLTLSIIFPCLKSQAESTEEKLEAYNMVVGVLPQLESQLDKLNTSISFAEEKIKTSKTEAMKNLFETELEKMEDQKESVESNIQKLTSVVDELVKDPEVGSLIEGEEAARKLKQKLDKATNLLPKVD
jgi:predicted  nucleic acid-binding Zn-ribbon protein